MADRTETHILGNAYLNDLGAAQAAVHHVMLGGDEGPARASITIVEGDADRETEVKVGEAFTAGGLVWRLDKVERFETEKIGGRHLEATVTRVG